jgi:hypothetical protein
MESANILKIFRNKIQGMRSDDKNNIGVIVDGQKCSTHKASRRCSVATYNLMNQGKTEEEVGTISMYLRHNFQFAHEVGTNVNISSHADIKS